MNNELRNDDTEEDQRKNMRRFNSQNWLTIKNNLIQLKNKQIKSQKVSSADLSQINITVQRVDTHFYDLIKRIKVDRLIKQFIYKLKRNISEKTSVKYDVIQKTLLQKKHQESLIKPFHMKEQIKAIIMAINIICILMIQVLMNFQGFYPKLRYFSATSTQIIVLQSICLVVFIIKIIISFTTTRIVDGVGLKYLKEVALYYLYSIIFIFDFLIFFLTLLKLIFPENLTIILLCYFVSIFAFPVISKDFQIIEVVYVNNYKKKQYFSMLKIFMFNIFFSQFISSILIAIAYWDIEKNWIIKAQNLGNISEDINWWQLYIYSLYWAVITTSTVGFGDLTPANYFEAIWITVILFFGTIILSYNVSSIGNIITNLRKIDEQRRQETVIFKNLARDQKFSQQLQGKILDYIQMSSLIKSEFQFVQRKKFVQRLPIPLQQQLQQEYSRNIFKNVPFFKLLTKKTLVQFSLKFNGSIHYPGQYITKKFCYLDKIVMVKNGKIGYAYYRQGSNLNGLVLEKRTINKDKDSPFLLNKYFLTQDQQINYQIVCLKYSFMLIIQFDDLYKILRQNPKDNEFFCYMYNKVQFINQQWQVNPCKYCAPKKHTIFICPKLHYMPFKSYIYLKYITSNREQQERRQKFKRRKKKFKRKEALSFWKPCFKNYQLKWQISYHKSIKKRIQSTKSFASQLNPIQEEHLSLNQLIEKICTKTLKSHCCQLFQIVADKLIQIDKLHNFVHFFPEFNPSNLNYISLRKSKDQRKFLIHESLKSRQQYQDEQGFSNRHFNI